MITHICIPVRDDVWDGYGLRLGIHDWLQENVGQQAGDMTDFVWGLKVGFMFRVSETKHNPMYQITGDRWVGLGAKYLHFLFRDPAKAVLFKLTWGGL